jgi:hypothetical protein
MAVLETQPSFTVTHAAHVFPEFSDQGISGEHEDDGQKASVGSFIFTSLK